MSGIVNVINPVSDTIKNHSKISLAVIVVLVLIILIQYAHSHKILTSIPGGAAISGLFKKSTDKRDKKRAKKAAESSDSDSSSDEEIDKLIKESS